MIKFSKLRSKNIIVKCILGIIIISIILSTLNNYLQKDTTQYIAKVNEEKINFETIKNMFDIELDKQKKILGKNFDTVSKNKTFKKNIYNYVLSQLINNILLEQYTKEIGFNIDQNEIKKIILNSEMFQENNKFNYNKYLNYLKLNNLTNNEYVDFIKKKINTINLIQTIAETNFILDNEKKDIIKLLSEKRIIKKSILKINSIKDQKINQTEILNYFKKNKNKFYFPEEFKISYIHIKPNISNVICNNNEIKNWYIKNIDKYSTKEKRRYSIIQVKTKQEADIILSKLQKGENFEKIAKQISIEPISSKKGGDIGWISVNLLPKEIKKANLNQENQISNIIEFNNEFLIIKLNKILLKKTKKISEVFDIIKSEIKYKKAISKFLNLKNKILFLSKKYKNNFDLIEEKSKIKSIETDWFNINSIPEAFKNTTLKKIILNKEFYDNKKIYVFELNNHQFFIFTLKKFKDKKFKKLQDIKNNIINILKYKKALKQTTEKAKKIVFQLNNGNKKIINQEHLFFNDSEILSRYDSNPIKSKIFSIPYRINQKNIYTFYQDKNNDFIIAFISKVYHEKFSEKEEEIIIKYLEKNNIENILNCIIKNLHKKSKIIYKK
ncbi:Periplasmic chaperone PpiD [Buchnera aphidicola (Protaphis terricola)]|uniref:SurA N-terminal domain-containing protein n=1 Tax=Buchnera aphidicola TaxID=9 RepID=UPI003463CC52